MFKSFKTFVLLAALSGLILLIGQAFSQNGLIIALFVAVAMNVGSYWFSDRLAIRMARAQEVPDTPEYRWYYDMVRGLSERAQAPMPRLYISPSPQPNAFATGRNPRNAAVCLNQGLIELLDPHEMEAVLAHELSHVYNRDILIGTIAATLATAITFVARFAFFFGGGGGGDRDNNPIAQIALFFLAPIAALLIQFAVTRSRETTADTSGAQLSGKPLALASALQKLDTGGRTRARLGGTEAERSPAFSQLYISAPFGGATTRGISSLFRTHPATETRVANLEAIARRMGQLA